MGGAGRSPAPEEDVEADPQIDQGDEPETLVETAVGGLENDRDFKAIPAPRTMV